MELSSPEWKAEEIVDFRAPPPSPVASGRRSSVTNAEVLSQFIQNSVRVPDLVLPDKVFPKLRFIQNPPAIDFLQLGPGETGVVSQIQEAMAAVGCFQVVNHGVSEVAVKAAMADGEAYAAHSLRRRRQPRRVRVVRRPKLHVRNGGISSSRIFPFQGKGRRNSDHHEEEDEVMRMLIRGFDHPHALSLHFCEGSSEFHVYSKKGWICFCPLPNALLVTLGDQLQVCSGGKYKQVVGRAIYKGDGDGGDELRISMAFLYSRVKKRDASGRNHRYKPEKTISLRQQLLFALFLSLFFRLCYTFQF
ncbi:PREDICTED: uncharacterized protein LOC104801499 [Tarenaya hassleriana]|uniref:uncharacterized protein LOC104801499 n=1 Tax=Tarenaya hassleriana TaxID=28532 RepID=UPI00053C367B|nr:PREDICTED: uncharacterized protein LOC104801499 [Tarenaya hassleriana]